MTSSEDGTVRVWDAWNVAQKTVIKPTLKKPGRVKVTTARYNSDGHIIAAGLENGTIQLWDVKGVTGILPKIDTFLSHRLVLESSLQTFPIVEACKLY